MKIKVTLILVVALLLSITTSAIAFDASSLIGTVVSYVEQIQEYPAAINDALCENDRDEYQLKMQELANLIVAANDAMRSAGLPNTLNLWAVYSAITANPHCGVHDAALSRADWSREELDRIGYKHGLFDTGVRMCGQFRFGMTLGEAYAQLGRECVGIVYDEEGHQFSEFQCNAMILTTCTYNPDYDFNGNLVPEFNIP
jgi:hypothetical protein